MCFGVRKALEIMRELKDPAAVTVRGELLHNPVVLEELKQRGFHSMEEGDAGIPETPSVLITAHGASDAERERLRVAGKTLIDTTCPLVRKAHDAAVQLEREGYFVVVIGKRKHVEVVGLVGDLKRFEVLKTSAEVKTWSEEKKIGIIAQTTMRLSEAEAIVEAIRRQNSHAQVHFENTICQPTRGRQEALERLLTQVKTLVVVGGKNSNNTAHLVERAKAAGLKALHVEGSGELCRDDFDHETYVGLTAGTSTLDETISAVQAELETF